MILSSPVYIEHSIRYTAYTIEYALHSIRYAAYTTQHTLY
jgi:hypothetical protein